MRAPKQPRKPHSLGITSERHEGGEISRETVQRARQDAAPTSELSPDEAQRVAKSVVGKWGTPASTPSPEEPEHKASSEIAKKESRPKVTAPKLRLPRRRRKAPQRTELSARRVEKQAERRKLIAKRAAIIGGGILAVVILVWALLFSPLLGLKADKVEVSGLDSQADLTASQVQEAMTQWEGAPVLRLPSGDIEEGLVSTFPLIESVQVGGKLPNGANVTLSLREPIACLIEDKTCVAIDAEGVRIPVSEEATSELPHLSLAKGQDAAGEAATKMIDVLDSLEPDTRSQVESISVGEALQMTLELKDGAEVTWGRSENNEFKAEVLAVLMTQGASSYDVSVPSAPVTG